MSDITVYSTPTCGYCKMAKAYLKSRDIDFEAVDISKSAKRMKEVQEISGQMGVPVINIKGKVVVGFNRPVIDALIREQGVA